MTRQLFDSGSDTEQSIGYSRAVVDGEWVFLSGTTGVNYAQGTIPESIEEQTEQCVSNIREVLAHAGCELADVVRVLYVVAHAKDIDPSSAILRKHFGTTRPACIMIVASLVDPRMRIEIQATARRGSGAQPRQTVKITLGSKGGSP